MASSTRSRRLLIQWVIGLLGSWLCVWIVGPWFVNSILVRVHDHELDTITLREGDVIRWRSEGWAETRIGRHGLPGWKPNDATTRMILWGDSQVEGFCVNDQEKLAAQCIQVAKQKYQATIDCLPMGRSGSDATDWSRIMDRADELWNPVIHVWVVTELSDLLAITSTDQGKPTTGSWAAESPAIIRRAKKFHADAAFQAARKLLFDPATGGIRSLRWAMGPIVKPTKIGNEADQESVDALLQKTRDRVAFFNERLDRRLALVYAPAMPRINGEVVLEHPDDEAWNTFAAMANDEIPIIDMRESFRLLWTESGKFARGFHNGSVSDGHLNRFGNQLVANAVVDWINEAGNLASPVALP
jgi:hypothetical protein